MLGANMNTLYSSLPSSSFSAASARAVVSLSSPLRKEKKEKDRVRMSQRQYGWRL